MRGRRPGWRPFALLPLLLLAPLGACGEAELRPGPPEVRDSAGITIVTNPDAPLPGWTIDTVPRVRIGSLEGGAGHELDGVRHAMQLADGRILIANGGTNQLWFYGPDGGFMRAVGGTGRGPGEFGWISAPHRWRGDTIVVEDVSNRRLTFVAPDGTLGRFPAIEWFHRVTEDPYTSWPLPFGRGFHSTTAGDLVWIGTAERFEVTAYGADGRPRTVVRVERAPEPITEAAQRRFVELRIAEAEEAGEETRRDMWREARDVMEFGRTMPAYASLESDVAGHLWVQDYRPPWEAGRTRWRVFDPDGRAVAEAVMPAGLAVFEIGLDYVLGRWRDEYDVEYVHLHRLQRSPPGGDR